LAALLQVLLPVVGAHHAMYFADRAIICTNPEVSSVRDSDKMLGILNRSAPGARCR